MGLVLCCGVPHAGFAQSTPNGISFTNVQITPKNYIAIDLSASVQAENQVNLIALDDNTNVSFGFNNSFFVNELTSLGYGYLITPQYYVYTLANGVWTAQTPLSLTQPDQQYPGTFNNLTPVGILSSGEVIGTFQNQTYQYSAFTAFTANGASFSPLSLPPPFSLGLSWQMLASESGPPLISAIASDGSYAECFTYDMAYTFHMTLYQFQYGADLQPGQYYDLYGEPDLATVIVSQNNERQAFDLENPEGVSPPGQYSGSYSGTTINTTQYFNPIAINTNGWGVGVGLVASSDSFGNFHWNWPFNYESSYKSGFEYYSRMSYECSVGDENNDDQPNFVTAYYGSQIWDGTTFHSLSGNSGNLTNSDIAVALNNQNQVIVQGYDTNAAPFQNYEYFDGTITFTDWQPNWNPTEGYLWEKTSSGSSNTIFRNVQTKAISNQISHIQPLAISNWKHPQLDANLDPSFYVLATSSDNGVTETNLFQRDKTMTNWIPYKIQFSSIPGPPTINQWISINSSGDIAALGTAGSVSGASGQDALVLVPADIVPDFNRDGVIDTNDYGRITTNNPYRFWIDDSSESDDIASGGNDIPVPSSQQTGVENLYHNKVNGKEDLINYFPLYLDISNLVKLLPPPQYTYSLSQADSAVSIVYTALKPSQAGGFLTNNAASSLLDNTTNLATASKVFVTALGTFGQAGDVIPTSWLNGIGDTNTAGGVLLVSGNAKTTNPLVLSISLGSQQVASVQFPLSIDIIANMYRWVNLRNVTAGGNAVRATATNIPSNYPDTNSNGKMVVFVHGYNVSETQSTAWFAEAFKRLYQSGANSMFTGVAWNGNLSQAVGITPNYWINVDNAFGTAAALSNAVASLPGTKKIIIAHSLGNMLVSSAIQDWGMNVSQYFMLNAAMPTEAFDTNTFGNTNMVFTGANVTDLAVYLPDPGWTNYSHNLWASYWYSLFTPSDGRYKLTWQNRFSNVVAASNFYSSGEEVLDNATNGTVGNPGAELAWADQELSKGTFLQSIASGVGYISSRGNAATITQGGWGLGVHWNYTFNPITGTYTYTPMSPQYANALTTNQLQANPFFTPFSDTKLTGPSGNTEATNTVVRAQVLGEAIPALSYAVGKNSVNKFGNNNVDMVGLEDVTSGIPQGSSYIDANHIKWAWHHGDAKDVAYPFTHKLWQNITLLGQLNKP